MLVTSGLSFVAALLAINAFVFWIVKKYPLKIYKFLPPVIIVFLIVVCCNTFGVWSFSNKAVSSMRSNILEYMVPFMVFCIAVQCDFKKMVKIGPKLLAVFLCTTLSICIGMVVVYKCFAGPLGLQQIPQSFGTWTASFTGGIENLYAVAGAVGLSDENLANVLLLINLIFRPWMTILIVMVPFAARFNKWTGGKPEEIDVIASRLDETKREKQIPTSLDLFMIMGVGLVIVAFGFHMGDFLGALIRAVPAQVWLYLMVTAIGVIIGTTTEFGYINGLELIGGTLAIFALSVSSSNVDLRSFANAGVFFLSGVTVLLIHVIIMFLVAKLMKVDLCTLGIASIANIGGVSSAPVVAAAYGKSYQSISVIMAAIGSMIGTFVGLGMCNLLLMMG